MWRRRKNRIGAGKRFCGGFGASEEAKEATWGEKQGKDGQLTKEYDSKCASIELKAVEYAVRLSGLLNEEREEEIQVVLGAETKELSG